jgi:hypothetical protein
MQVLRIALCYINPPFYLTLLQNVHGKITHSYFTIIESMFEENLFCFYNGQNLGKFYYVFYAISVVLLVFILWNTLKMIIRVTETRTW